MNIGLYVNQIEEYLKHDDVIDFDNEIIRTRIKRYWKS